MKNYNNKISLIILVAMIVFVIPALLGASRLNEAFSPGKYPCSVIQLPLSDVYKGKSDFGYTNNNSKDIYLNKPVFHAKHCGTNNIRYWRRPTNGLCSPAGMCEGLYDTTEPSIPSRPIPPEWSEIPRVNFYVSHE